MEHGIPGKNPLACFDRDFLLRVIAAAAGLVLLALLGRALGLEKGSLPRVALGLAQVGVMGYAIAITVGSIRKLDEMQYRIQLEAIAFAFGASAIVLTGWGFLEKAGLPPLAWGTASWPLMVLCWALGLGISRRRYR